MPALCGHVGREGACCATVGPGRQRGGAPLMDPSSSPRRARARPNTDTTLGNQIFAKFWSSAGGEGFGRILAATETEDKREMAQN